MAVVYDIDDNDLIDFGDFSYFTPAYGHTTGEAEPPYIWWADFDQNGQVGFADFTYFAPPFGHGKPDADIIFPPSFGNAWIGAKNSQPKSELLSNMDAKELQDVWIDVELVAVSTPTSSHQISELPSSLENVSVGNSFSIEVWVQDVLSPGLGITGGYVDVDYTTARTDDLTLDHGGVFTMLLDGSIDDGAGLVDDFGGGTFTAGVGIEPNWVRLGSIDYSVTDAGPITLTFSPGRLAFSRFGAGNVPWENVSLGELTLNAPISAEIVGRHIFYNHSAWDGNNVAANEQDDAAIAPEECADPHLRKLALLPGQTATFQNYTSYSLGINGIMVDFDRLPGTPTVADFEFKVSNTLTPDSWTAAPADPNGDDTPNVAVRGVDLDGDGTPDIDRVTIIWPLCDRTAARTA